MAGPARLPNLGNLVKSKRALQGEPPSGRGGLALWKLPLHGRAGWCTEGTWPWAPCSRLDGGTKWSTKTVHCVEGFSRPRSAESVLVLRRFV